MSNIPESLRRVLAKLPQKPGAKLPATDIYTATETTTILRDGTVYRTKRDGSVKYLPSVPSIP